MLTEEHVAELRSQFPGLAREMAGRPAIFFDGPGGTQVPQRVIDAVGGYLAHTNANLGGHFATSQEASQEVAASHLALADLLGADDPDCVVFGLNMTSLTLSLSRSLARTWKRGDEIVVTRLDHDANFTPWKLAAEEAGATVRVVEIRREDCTLDLEDLRRKLTGRTRLVAVGCASNAVGTVNPVKKIAHWAHETGALVFLDAVHYAPHARIDVQEWDCDFLALSAYKFFGPHVGALWGKRQYLEELPAYKVRPASNALPVRWMAGTQNDEGGVGAREAVAYLADIGRRVSTSDRPLSRDVALDHAFESIRQYERRLCRRLLDGLQSMPHWKVWGITAPDRDSERLPTIGLTHRQAPAAAVARFLARRGVFVWDGNFYAPNLTEALQLEPQGMVRIGLVHYNTAAEVDRLLETLDSFPTSE